VRATSQEGFQVFADLAGLTPREIVRRLPNTELNRVPQRQRRYSRVRAFGLTYPSLIQLRTTLIRGDGVSNRVIALSGSVDVLPRYRKSGRPKWRQARSVSDEPFNHQLNRTVTAAGTNGRRHEAEDEKASRKAGC
jgi:hypothetical protein